MKFDVIIGNPPYQLKDGGGRGSSAKPIYHLFIEQAKKLNPRYLCMIIPARWYSGGKGLDDFRNKMLADRRIKKLVDYEDSRDCFPGVDIAGGICYFLWQNDYDGICEVENIRKSQKHVALRFLDEYETFIRDNLAIRIVQKVKENCDSFLDDVVSSRMPFGIPSNAPFDDDGDLNLITNSGRGKILSRRVTSGQDLINKWKVLLSKTSSDHAGQPGRDGKRRIFSRIEVMPPKTICTESYLVVGKYDTCLEAEHMVSYLKTKFCRFLASVILLTQNITKDKFAFVPKLPMTKAWTDEELYKKYGLTQEEIDFIESMIRPMEVSSESDDSQYEDETAVEEETE
ncbi:MAG: Eco57I restriction-modification methylase domain-containing protein, partial [Chloroherpetonaceae bacterium]|nr:Eco57I restriction-modification methylase domain-containing protein [Chloroherpetonaceae bacterium]